jgi:hypothetical protein
MDKEQFVAKFKERLGHLLPREVVVDEQGYINLIAQTYWDDPDQRAEGPEECAEAEASEWGEE